MKKLLTISLLVIASALCAKADDYPLSTMASTLTGPLLSLPTISTNGTNQLAVGRADYHTIHIVNTGTNTAQVALERTIDGTNYFILGTNTVAPAAIYETNFVGRYQYIRARAYVTNSTLLVNYLGGM